MINLKIKTSHDVTIRPENMWHTIIECRMDEDDFADAISSLSSEQQRKVLDALDKVVVNEWYNQKERKKMDIEEAAKTFASLHYRYDVMTPRWETRVKRLACIAGFKAGAKWQRSQVWHNPEEMPEEGKILLAQTKYGPYICGPDNEYWKETAIEMSVIRWAYTDNLLPEGGEE